MKKLFGSSGNAGSMVGRMTQQTMQYAGKAEKTVDDDYKLLSVQFKECQARVGGSEKILQLHYDATLGIMGAYDGILERRSKHATCVICTTTRSARFNFD